MFCFAVSWMRGVNGWFERMRRRGWGGEVEVVVLEGRGCETWAGVEEGWGG